MSKSAEPDDFGPPESYSVRWQGWVDDPLIKIAGVTFDRTPSGRICAPPDRYRICAYHIDFDERPTCWFDVESLTEALYVCERIRRTCPSWNVDYAVAYDDKGHPVTMHPQGK